MSTDFASEQEQGSEQPWTLMHTDDEASAASPEEPAALPLAGMPARAVPKQRRIPWLAWLIVLTLLWPLIYGPLIYVCASGWRPPWLWLRQFLLALFGVHTALLVLGWGGQWLRREWQRQAEQRRFEATRTLEQLLALSPGEFEDWTAAFFERYDYQVRNTPDTADHGIDLMVTSPRGERAVVQCKRYRGTVGEPVVRDLYGTMLHTGADLGFLVTTGSISRAARAWAQGKPLELIDGDQLVRLAE
jgi:restriction system protein